MQEKEYDHATFETDRLIFLEKQEKNKKEKSWIINLYFSIFLFFSQCFMKCSAAILKHLANINNKYIDPSNYYYPYVIADGQEYHSGSLHKNANLLPGPIFPNQNNNIEIKEIEVSIDDEEFRKINEDKKMTECAEHLNKIVNASKDKQEQLKEAVLFAKDFSKKRKNLSQKKMIKSKKKVSSKKRK
jgi:hypothetical protein